jgi:hypothetical protein
MDVIYTTKDGIKIGTIPGRKSPSDFRVRYKEPDKRERQPKHAHIAVDLLIKYAFQKKLTVHLRDHLLEILFGVHPSKAYPPQLQIFEPSHIELFRPLDKFGNYTVEFILVAGELIIIQEITNRAHTLGHEPTLEERKLQAYQMYYNVDKDFFKVVSAATWKGRGAIT